MCFQCFRDMRLHVLDSVQSIIIQNYLSMSVPYYFLKIVGSSDLNKPFGPQTQ